MHKAKCIMYSCVQVANWGSGEPGDLGELRVEQHSEQYAGDESRPLYERLARELQLAEVRGGRGGRAGRSRGQGSTVGEEACCQSCSHEAVAARQWVSPVRR